MNRIDLYIKEPWRIPIAMQNHGLGKLVPDKVYITAMFKNELGKELDLNNPKSFNEKLQWLKLNDRNPLYVSLVDKFEVKKYVADIIGKDKIIPTLEVWDSVEEIDLQNLPKQFVLKCTHDSGGVVICKDKSLLDVDFTKEILDKSMKRNFYYAGREWPYKNVKPRIICEKYMIDSKVDELRDYKFFCFNGKVKCFKIDFDRFTEHRANYYDINCNLLYFGENVCPPNYNKELEIPKQLNEMIYCAEKLSENIPFVRVDFYCVEEQIYFGEMTFFPASGFGSFEPPEWDEILGSWIDLKDKGGL